MKYIIEIKPEYEGTTKGIIVLGIKNNCLCVDELAIEELEELNSDYINEHFGELQETAYKKGLHDGESKCGYCNEYQRGLNAAWEAARKIVTWPDRSLVNSDTFDLDPGENIFTKYSASEAITKLKAYEEQKATDELKVGDEVIDTQSGTRFCVTHFWVNNHGEKGVSGFNHECSALQDTNDNVKKTGRHFEIDKILEAMKE